MKKFAELIKKVPILLVGLLTSLPALAESVSYTFSYTYEGNEVYYEVLDYVAGTCKTSAGTTQYGSIQPVSGDLVIPETVYDGYHAYRVVDIGKLSFYKKDHISSVKLPSSIKTVGEEAFAYCNGLTSVTFLDSNAKIDTHAFTDCSNLASVNLGNNLESIGYESFYNCGITSLIIPESIQSLAREAFGHNPITEVVFNAISCSSLESGDCFFHPVFSSCPITKVTFGKNVTKIPNALLYYIPSIEEVIFNAENCEDSEVEEYYWVGNQKTNYMYVLPSSMKKLTVGNDVKRIPANTFMNSELESITMGSSVSEIAGKAFRNCPNLKSIVIPESVITIGEHAFSNCVFDEVKFNANTMSSGNKAFYDSTINELNIGKNVKKIADATFCGCGIEIISIPDNVTEIGKSAFAYCGSKSIRLGNSVTIINEKAFCNLNVDALETLEIPKSVKYIGSNAFNVSRQIIFAGTPETIEENGLYSGNKLRHIFMPDPNEWCSANIGEMKLTYDNLFVNDTKVENLCLKPANGIVTKYCFKNAPVKRVRIDADKVEKYAFSGSSMEALCLNVNSIDEYAFEAPTEVYCLTPEPPAVSSDHVFMSYGGTLFVPVGSRAKYERSLYCWYLFDNIVETDFAGIDDKFKANYTIDNAAIDNIINNDATQEIDFEKPYEIITINGLTVGSDINSLAPGIYIIRQNGKTVKYRVI